MVRYKCCRWPPFLYPVQVAKTQSSYHYILKIWHYNYIHLDGDERDREREKLYVHIISYNYHGMGARFQLEAVTHPTTSHLTDFYDVWLWSKHGHFISFYQIQQVSKTGFSKSNRWDSPKPRKKHWLRNVPATYLSNSLQFYHSMLPGAAKTGA